MLAGLVLLVRLAITVNTFSRTIDEPVHLGGAISTFEAHKSIAGVAHPPIIKWVAMIPLYFDGVRLPAARGVSMVQKEDVAYAWGTNVLYDSPKPMRTILSHARLAMLIFPILSLLYLFLLTRYLAGEWAAAAAVVFFSVDPSLLGHSIWVGTDVAATAGMLAGIFYFMRWLDDPTRTRAMVAGLAVGLAVAAKFSCVLMVPAMGLILLLRSRSLPLVKVVQHIAIGFAVGFVAIWSTYLFNIGTLGEQNVLGHPPAWERLPGWVLHTSIPMPSFFLGVARQAGHNQFGHLAFLNGKVSLKGWWYYFPEILVVKSTIAFLIALLLALWIWLFSKGRLDKAVQATLIPAGVFFLVSMNGKIDIGVRHILPAIALLYVFCAVQLGQKKWKPLLSILILVSSVETAVAHPDYLSFFNVAVGGARGGQKIAADSNIDWGQDGYRMADWIKANHADDCAIRLCALRNIPLLQSLGIDPQALQRPVHGRLLLIDLNARLIEGRLPWLSRMQPIARIGDSVEVYDLRGSLDQPNEPDDMPLPDVPQMQSSQP